MTSTTGSSYNPGKPPIQLLHSPLILGFQEVKYRMISARRKSEVEFSLTTVPQALVIGDLCKFFRSQNIPCFGSKVSQMLICV
ncbi:hypothetical protein Hanom_Chr13g01212911 [Helianthus anomalus]